MHDYEIKIRFKSGQVGLFKSENSNFKKVYDCLGDAIRDGANGVLELIDLEDNKITIVNIQDISTFGYGEVSRTK